MSHSDNDVVIGSRTRGGAGGPREKVVRGASALNAAARAGNIATSKNEFFAANAAASSQNGQFKTKVAESNDIVKLKPKDTSLDSTFKDMVSALGIKQTEFAQKAGVAYRLVFPQANDPPVTEDTVNKIQKTYGMYVKGDLKGTRYGKSKFASITESRTKLAVRFPTLKDEDKPTPVKKPVAKKP